MRWTVIAIKLNQKDLWIVAHMSLCVLALYIALQYLGVHMGPSEAHLLIAIRSWR